MARTIGAVEVTVDANTRKLRVHLIRDAGKIGEEAKAVLDKELSKVEAELFLNSKAARAELEKFQIAAERANVDLPVGLNVDRAKAELEELKQEIEQVTARFDVDLSKEAAAELRAELDRLAEEKRQIEFGIEMEPQATAILEAQLERIETEHRTVQMEAVLDEAEALAELRLLEEQKIEIGFTSDLTEATAEYETWATRLGNARISPVIDGDFTDFELALKELKAQVALEKFQIKLEADERAVDATLAKIQAEAEAVARKRRIVEFQMKLDDRQFQLDTQAAVKLAERQKVDIDFTGDFSAITKDVIRYNQQLKLQAFDINVGADMTEAIADAEFLLAFIDNADAELPVGADMTKARLAIDFFRAVEEHDDLRLPVGIDVDALEVAWERAKVKSSGQAADAGQKSGDEWGKGFKSGFSGSFDQGKIIAVAIASMGDALGVGLEGLTSVATQVISSGFSAIGGAAGAAAPLVAAFAGSMAAVVVGSRGFTEALKGINKEFAAAQKEGREMDLNNKDIQASLANLAPAARHAAEAFAGIREQLGQVRLDVQQKLFSGMSDVIHDLAKTALPDASKAMQTFATETNRFGKELAGVATKTDFSGLAKGLQPALMHAGGAATALVETLEPFLKTATPAAKRLAEMLERGALSMRDLVKNNPDAIGKFLDEGVTSLRQWTKLLKDAAELIGIVFKAGKTGGDSFVSSLDHMILRWGAFLRGVEGQNKLEEFFDRGKQVMDALRPVLDGLKEAFANMVGGSAMANFESLTRAVGAALPAFGDLLTLTSGLKIGQGVADFVGALTPLLDLLNALPDPLLQFIGMLIVADKVVGRLAAPIGKAINAIQGMTAALRGVEAAEAGISSANLAMLGLTAAVVTGMAIFEAFSEDQAELDAHAKELADSINSEVDALVAAGKAADGFAVGATAVNNALGEIDSSKLTNLFGEINKGIGTATLGTKDMTNTILGLRDKPVEALSALAEGYGLPEGPAKKLADLVNSNLDGFELADAGNQKLTKSFEDLSKSTGLPVDELRHLAQVEKDILKIALSTDVEKTSQTFLDQASAGDKATQATLEHAKALAEQRGVADSSFETWKIFIGLQYDTANAIADGFETQEEQIANWELSEQSMKDVVIAQQEHEAALKKERDAAYQADVAERRLREQVDDLAASQAAALGVSEDLATGFEEVGKKAHAAERRASAFKSVIDLLISPTANVQQSFSDIQQSIDDISEALEGGTEAADKREEAWDKQIEANKELAEANKQSARGDAEAAQNSRDRAAELHAESVAANAAADSLEKHAKTLDDTNEVGRENAELMRTLAEQYLNAAGAMITQGATADEVNTKLAEGRKVLEDNATAFLGNRDAAKKYVDTLLGTPEILTTVVNTPGLIDALLNTDKLTVTYDKLGQPVIKEFEAIGLDQASYTSEAFLTTLEKLGLIDAKPQVDLSGAQVTAEDVEGIQTGVDVLDETTATPTVEADTRTADEKLSDLQTQLTTLNTTVVHPVVEITNIDTMTTKVKDLDRLLRNLPNAIAGLPQPGGGTGVTRNMAGSIVRSPTISMLGEFSRREAIIPLDLPLNRVDRSVRDMAAYLRGADGKVQFPPTKVVNNYMTITPQAADPAAVATSVINRAAAMAANL